MMCVSKHYLFVSITIKEFLDMIIMYHILCLVNIIRKLIAFFYPIIYLVYTNHIRKTHNPINMIIFSNQHAL